MDAGEVAGALAELRLAVEQLVAVIYPEALSASVVVCLPDGDGRAVLPLAIRRASSSTPAASSPPPERTPLR